MVKYVIKKDGTKELYDFEKIVAAVNKSAERVMETFNDSDILLLKQEVETRLLEVEHDEIDILVIHKVVESVLDVINKKVASSYKDYRNYKTDFVAMLDGVYKKSQSIMYIGDKENSNTDSALVSTKRSLIFNELNKELYKKFFLNKEELQACKDGYIYIHDMSARRDTFNCCLFDVANVLKGGFEMGNIWYNEPKTLDTAFDVIADVVVAAASNQYGGLSVCEVDKILKPYAEKSYKLYITEYEELTGDTDIEKANTYAMKKLDREFMQGFQGWEYKFNTVASSRGDYPFISMSFGLGQHEFERMASINFLKTRQRGQGKEGNKKPVLFPKLIFLYDENLHGEGKPLEDVFNAGVECSRHSMYPDWLSMSGQGYVPEMYKKYGEVVTAMGCRAFLSPYYKEGGFTAASEDDKPFFVGRFNIGAISLHLPMIYAKAKHENKNFYEVLDYYLEIIRKLHIKTYEYLGEMKASVNPLAYCEGGLHGGKLQPHEKIKPLLEYATASFGVTALNELQQLHNKKSILEDGEFALEVMHYINDKVDQFKNEDKHLYAIYGTPAESLCGLQVEQFRKKYGVIEGVSDRTYVTNSFHCHVAEDITPIQKQDAEKRFWDLFNGGKIQYVKYPINYNVEAIKTLIRRAMKMGLYEGVNLALSYCEDCGHEQLNMDVCPKCGSENLTKIDRMNGYLSYSRVKGDTRLNKAKMDEISERISM